MRREFGSISPDSIIVESDNFPAGRTTGSSIAALKCLLGLGLRINFKTKTCQISIDELEVLTGLSRPMVIAGIKHLVSIGLVTKEARGGNSPTTYRLIFRDEKSFTKVPFGFLYDNLKNFPNKGIENLIALKAYIVMLQVRPKKSLSVKISYDRFSDYSINTKHLGNALSILIVRRLIRVTRDYPTKKDEGYIQSSNEYQILHLKIPEN